MAENSSFEIALRAREILGKRLAYVEMGQAFDRFGKKLEAVPLPPKGASAAEILAAALAVNQAVLNAVAEIADFVKAEGEANAAELEALKKKRAGLP